MGRGCFPILLFVGAMFVVTNCRISINGYSFDYKGAKSERNEFGSVDSTVKQIVVDNQFGEVRVEAHDGEPGWTWTGACWATDAEDADAFLEELKLVVTQSGDSQTWKLEMPSQKRKLRGVRSDLVVKVPATVAVSTENSHGDTAVEKISGQVSVDSRHGNVELTEIMGTVKVENKHGRVAAHGLASKAEFDVKHGDSSISSAHGPLVIEAKHGDVKLTQAGAEVEASIQHGHLTADQVRGNVNFRSSHGGVRLTMVGDQFNEIEGDARHANVQISLPASSDPRLDIDLSHGRLTSDFGDSTSGKTRVKIDGSHSNVKLKKGN